MEVKKQSVTLVAALLAALTVLLLGAAGAHAASGQIAIVPTNPSPQPSGAPLNYSINFTCSATEAEGCGEDPTITIPLELTSSLPETPPMDGWNYVLTSPIAGLVEGWEVVGGELVVHIDEALLTPGKSLTIQLAVRPPNGFTPDGTSWELQPSLSSSNIPEVAAPAAAPGAASADPKIAVSKNTNDGGSIYVRGNQVVYNITASCNAGFPNGSLYLTESRMVDQLPPGAVFVSADPEPTAVVGNELVWEFANPGTMPPSCVPGAGGRTNYQVVAEIPGDTPDETVFHNEVTMFGTAVGDPDTELETSAPKDVTVIAVPPASPGVFLGKESQGPLEIEGLGFTGTYPGHWIDPIAPTPSQNPGQAEGRYTVRVAYPASRAFETDLVDPVPCLDEKTGVKYSSLNTTLPVDGSASAPLCANPAFHPTVIRVASASLPQAVAGGWEIELITTDGTVIPVAQTSASGTSSYFSVPTAYLGEIAAVRLPPNARLTDQSMTMDVWGYADPTTEGGEILEDVAAASAYPVGGEEPAGSGRQAAELYIEENQLQLAIDKSFGGYRAAPGGTTALNLVGGIAIPTALVPPGPIVLADLLPAGMSWTNPPGSGEVDFTLSQGATNLGPITGTVEHIPNYENYGRELVRVSFDPGDFPGEGYYRLTPPANFILVSVPSGARTFNNSAQIFASGAGRSTSPACGTARNAIPSQFESEDPLDLDGDGETAENHCSSNANLVVPAEGGPAFDLAKQVQGDLDSMPKGPPGIGQASNGGSGEYTLTWRNIGGVALESPVVYDVLPYVGDTGIVEGQTSTPRGSQFQVIFDEVTALDPGVTVEYSGSTNPCRPEVMATNPGCVDDWSASPDDPAAVRALRFAAAADYQPGETFAMKFKVALPLGEVNSVAWNSSATAAEFNDGTPLKPAEPPKVGITAPLDSVTPTLSTQVSAADLDPGGSVTDTITVGNSDEINGKASWQLRGPVEVEDESSCEGVDWSDAPLADQGDLTITGSGPYETSPTTLTGFGCYGYVVTLEGTGYTGPVTSPAGSENEVVIVRRLPTNVSTRVSAADLAPDASVHDTIAIAGSEGREGEVEWQLLGPVAIGNGSGCDQVDWEGAEVYDEGSFEFTGDGEYATEPTTLAEFGCYGYAVTVGGGDLGWSVTSPAGSPNEVVVVRRVQPTVTTQVASAELGPGAAATDRITVGGSEARPGLIEWELVGPVPMAPDWTCNGVSWAGAPSADKGTIATSGDGEYTTAPTALTALGCYSYAVTVGGEKLGNAATSPAGSPNEVVLVRDPAGALEVRKRADRQQVKVGARVTYTITVTNNGPGPVPDVVLLDKPQTPMEFVSAKPSQGSCGSGFPLSCSLGTLAAGARATVKVVAKPLAAGKAVNEASVTTPDPKGGRDRDRSRIDAFVQLGLSKVASKSSLRAGERIAYRIVVTNPSVAVARDVRVCDRPPAGLEVLATAPQAKLEGGRYCWRIDSIKAGGKRTLKVLGRALEGFSGKLVNRAELSGAGAAKARAKAAVRVRGAKLRPGGVTG